MNEHGLTVKVRAWLTTQRARGVWHAKLAGGPFQMAGLPDFMLCVGGLFAALELKHPSDLASVQSPGQRRVFDLVRAAGGHTCVARDLATVQRFVFALELRAHGVTWEALHVADTSPHASSSHCADA